MIRFVITIGAVFVARFIIAALVKWLANRRTASEDHVLAVTNTSILMCVALAVMTFHGEGITAYSAVFAVLMAWLLYGSMLIGLAGSAVVKRNRGLPSFHV